MSIPNGDTPRNIPDGAYKRWCPQCGATFQTDNEHVLYCTYNCKSSRANSLYYEKHRDEVIAAVQSRRKASK